MPRNIAIFAPKLFIFIVFLEVFRHLAMFPEIARAYSPDYEIFMHSTGFVRKY